MRNWVQHLHLQVCCIFLLLSYKNQHPSLSLKNCPQQSCKTKLCWWTPSTVVFWGKFFTHLHFWKTTFLRKVLLVCRCFSFISLNISSLSLLACQLSCEKSSDILKVLQRISFLWAFVFILMLLKFSLCVDYNVSWRQSFWMNSEEWPISYMNLNV